MSSQQSSAIRKMARNAQEMNLAVMQGQVHTSAETIHIGGHDLLAWLAAHEGEEIVLILGPVDGVGEVGGGRMISAEPRICRKCGRDYIGNDCDHCSRQRVRIRGS